MILVVDIGNTNVVFGLYDNSEWKYIWRFETIQEESVYYYKMKLSQCFIENDVDPQKVDSIVLSSVVPDLTQKFCDFLREINKESFVLLNHEIYEDLPVSTINPYEMGTDLMANAVAANAIYPQDDVLIIDFGTALTFTLLRKDGNIEGVNILPGIKTAIKALSSNTAQLHQVSLKRKRDSVMGKTTIEAIQNGVLIGYSGLVNHMIKVIKDELSPDAKIIATGGLSGILEEIPFDHEDMELTLNGLRVISERRKELGL